VGRSLRKRLKIAAISLKLATFGLYVGRCNPTNFNYAIYYFPVKGHDRGKTEVSDSEVRTLQNLFRAATYRILELGKEYGKMEQKSHEKDKEGIEDYINKLKFSALWDFAWYPPHLGVWYNKRKDQEDMPC
jgi:hypothetical protein